MEYTIVNREDYRSENILIQEILHSLLYLISLKEKFQILNDTVLEKVTDLYSRALYGGFNK